MKDGEKESTKELLAFFRSIFTTDVSILLLSISLREKISITSPILFFISISFLLISAILCLYIFSTSVPKLFREESGIIYQIDIVLPGLAAIGAFVIGGSLLVMSQIV